MAVEAPFYEQFFLSSLMETLDERIDNVLLVAVDDFTDSIGVPMTVALNISLALLGWRILSGSMQQMTLAQLREYVVKINLIAYAFLYVGDLVIFLRALFDEQPILWAAGILGLRDSGLNYSIYQQIDYIYLDGTRKAFELLENWRQPVNILLAIAMFIASTSFIVITSILLIGHKIIATILLIFTPLFIGLLLFEKSKGMTEAWIKQLVTSFFTILFVLVMVVMSVQLTSAVQLGGTRDLSDVLQDILILVIMAFFVNEMPGIARQIGGGIGLETGLAGFNSARGLASTFLASRRQGQITRGLRNRS